MKVYNALMSSILTGVVAHELTHLAFYRSLVYVGFTFGNKNVAMVCGITNNPNTEPLAEVVGIAATILVLVLTYKWGKK